MADLRPGDTLGPYEILECLATGGMARLYLARSQGLHGFEKRVVVKLIRPELADEPLFIKMFLDEARIAATLHNSNIVQVYDIGAEADRYFLVMEYLKGADLRRLLAQLGELDRAMPLDAAVAVTTGVLAGLHYAHEQVGFDGRPLDIVHRDVSPTNVFLTREGGVKLLDFGVARAANRLAPATRAGVIKGKFRYASPEQLLARPVDRRSDVFSLATVLWEITTGRRLFDQEADLAVLQAISEQDAPAPSTLVAGYPPDLEAIVMRGLRRDPAARYQTAEDFQVDLEAFAREQGLGISSLTVARVMREAFGAGRGAVPPAGTARGDTTEPYGPREAALADTGAAAGEQSSGSATLDSVIRMISVEPPVPAPAAATVPAPPPASVPPPPAAAAAAAAAADPKARPRQPAGPAAGPRTPALSPSVEALLRAYLGPSDDEATVRGPMPPLVEKGKGPRGRPGRGRRR